MVSTIIWTLLNFQNIPESQELKLESFDIVLQKYIRIEHCLSTNLIKLNTRLGSLSIKINACDNNCIE